MWNILENEARSDGKFIAVVKGGNLVLCEGQGVPSKVVRIPQNRLEGKFEGSKWLISIASDDTREYLTYYKAMSEPTDIGEDSAESAVFGEDGAKMHETDSATEKYPMEGFNAYIDRLKFKFLNITMDIGSNAFLVGPKGCGKSTIARAIADYRNCQFFEFDMSQAIKPKKFFIGGVSLKGDHTEIVRSEFFKAYTSSEPTVLFLDELTRIPDQASNYLMTMLSKGQSYIYDEDSGERFYKGENVYIIAAGNFGTQYLGTQLLDSAFLDRFVKIHLDYPPAYKETDLICEKVPGVPREVAGQLVKCANILRKSNNEDGVSQTLSTRTLLDCAAFVKEGISLQDVIHSIIIESYLDQEDRNLATQLLAGL